MTNRERIGTVIAANARYYGKNLDEVALAFYIEDLAEYPAEIVSVAVAEHRRSPEGRFMPRTSDIIGLIEKKRTPEIDPVTAWNEVMLSFRTSKPSRFNPVVKRAIDAVGGLQRIGMATVGFELDRIREQFVKALQVHEKREVFEQPLLLPQQGHCAD